MAPSINTNQNNNPDLSPYKNAAAPAGLPHFRLDEIRQELIKQPIGTFAYKPEPGFNIDRSLRVYGLPANDVGQPLMTDLGRVVNGQALIEQRQQQVNASIPPSTYPYSNKAPGLHAAALQIGQSPDKEINVPLGNVKVTNIEPDGTIILTLETKNPSGTITTGAVQVAIDPYDPGKRKVVDTSIDQFTYPNKKIPEAEALKIVSAFNYQLHNKYPEHVEGLSQATSQQRASALLAPYLPGNSLSQPTLVATTGDLNPTKNQDGIYGTVGQPLMTSNQFLREHQELFAGVKPDANGHRIVHVDISKLPPEQRQAFFVTPNGIKEIPTSLSDEATLKIVLKQNGSLSIETTNTHNSDITTQNFVYVEPNGNQMTHVGNQLHYDKTSACLALQLTSDLINKATLNNGGVTPIAKMFSPSTEAISRTW
jgi:hypothetical protein